jgi:hypothetical protein
MECGEIAMQWPMAAVIIGGGFAFATVMLGFFWLISKGVIE